MWKISATLAFILIGPLNIVISLYMNGRGWYDIIVWFLGGVALYCSCFHASRPGFKSLTMLTFPVVLSILAFFIAESLVASHLIELEKYNTYRAEYWGIYIFPVFVIIYSVLWLRVSSLNGNFLEFRFSDDKITSDSQLCAILKSMIIIILPFALVSNYVASLLSLDRILGLQVFDVIQAYYNVPLMVLGFYLCGILSVMAQTLLMNFKKG